MAKYKLESGLPQQIRYIVNNENGISNPTDKMLDDLNVGMYLDNTATIPSYDTLTHYVQTKYTVINGKIVLGYDVLAIVPSDVEILKNDMNDANNLLLEIDFRVMLNDNGLTGLETVYS